jgi:hypothetical protein
MTSVQKRKAVNVEAFGGACQHCGYSRCARALQFHHQDASEKDLWSATGKACMAEIEAHPERFILLCANCHFEEHDRLDEATRTFADCLHCGKRFQTKSCLLEAGRGKYCSRSCHKNHWSDTSPDRIADRFWAKVDKSGDCWIWTAYRENGSGMFGLKSADGVHKPQTAHRTSWILHHGPIPKGMEIIRTCRNLACVRPEHLAIGDRKRTGMNRVNLAKTNRGERSGASKLTEENVRDIRHRYAAGGITLAMLGAEYGVSAPSIHDIVRMVTWIHV